LWFWKNNQDNIKVPKGKVFAVDSDSSMITVAKENLAEISNIQYKKADL
jgi:ubiquinone/menaquinone biosynthesis C-methylase UbiE